MLKIFKKIIEFVFCKLLYRVKYVNIEVFEKEPSAVIFANHSNYKDPLYIFPKFMDLKVMAKEELFKNKIIAKIFRYLGAFEIKRGKKDARSLIHAIHLFKNQTKLLIFPEGTRVDKEEVAAKFGAVYIALKADVPIIPTYITVKPKLFSSVLVIFLDPVYIDKTKAKDKEYLQNISDEILKNIYTLKNK